MMLHELDAFEAAFFSKGLQGEEDEFEQLYDVAPDWGLKDHVLQRHVSNLLFVDDTCLFSWRRMHCS